MKKPWYDCSKGIEEHLNSLEKINELASARYEAGYNRNEILSEWCILGFIFTDAAGDFSPITQGAPADGYLEKICLNIQIILLLLSYLLFHQ